MSAYPFFILHPTALIDGNAATKDEKPLKIIVFLELQTLDSAKNRTGHPCLELYTGRHELGKQAGCSS
jgi:hypothetical protein